MSPRLDHFSHSMTCDKYSTQVLEEGGSDLIDYIGWVEGNSKYLAQMDY